MRPFIFRVDRLDAEPVVRNRTLGGPIEALAYARQLLSDWPECVAVEVLVGDELLERLRPPHA